MVAIILALAPLFIILMVGHTLKKTGFIADTFWSNLEKLTYWALLPALFLKTTSEAEFSDFSLLSAVLASVTLLGVMMLLMVALRHFTPKIDGASYSSIIQGATRFNNYVGLPAIVSLYGRDGVVVYAVIASFIIPLTNITSVWALSHYASHTRIRWHQIIKRIFTNPLILSTLVGIILGVTGIGLPPIINETVTAFANASLLMGLLAIGANLNLGAVRTDRSQVLYSCFLKLLLYPAIAVGCGLLFNLNHQAMGVLILFASLPTATSSYILAGQMGGNARLMANILATQTLMAFATMPLWLLLSLHYFPV